MLTSISSNYCINWLTHPIASGQSKAKSSDRVPRTYIPYALSSKSQCYTHKRTAASLCRDVRSYWLAQRSRGISPPGWRIPHLVARMFWSSPRYSSHRTRFDTRALSDRTSWSSTQKWERCRKVMVVLKAYNLLASICSFPITSDNHTYIHIYLHMNVLHLH